MHNTAQKQLKLHKFKFGTVLIYAGLILYFLFLFLPLYTVFISAFIPHTEITASAEFIWWPQTFTLDSFKMLLLQDPQIELLGISSIISGFFNTMWMTLLPLLIGLLVSGLAAYAYTLLRFPGKNFLFMVTIITMTIPLGAFGMVSYLFYEAINWTKTVLPIIIPGMFGGAGTVFFLKMYLEGIGKEMSEAAKIDGAGVFSIFFKIIFPCTLPAFIAQFIFGFVGGYNNYMGPLLYLYDDPAHYTLQLAVSELQSYFGPYPEVLCASAVVAMVPLIIMYCFTQKFFIQGIAVGGGKE